MTTPVTTDGPAVTNRLTALADELTAAGWPARLLTRPGRVPCLHVSNPAARALSEDVYAQPDENGTWQYWWPWAQPIALSTADAAQRICRVLGAGAAR